MEPPRGGERKRAKKSLCMGSLEADNGMRILKVIVFRKSCEKGCIEEDGSSSFDAPESCLGALDLLPTFCYDDAKVECFTQ